MSFCFSPHECVYAGVNKWTCTQMNIYMYRKIYSYLYISEHNTEEWEICVCICLNMDIVLEKKPQKTKSSANIP